MNNSIIALKIYKFFDANNIEWHRFENTNNTEIQIFCFIPFHCLGDFLELIKSMARNILQDGGIDCKFQDGFIALDILPILEYLGLEEEEINEVFEVE